MSQVFNTSKRVTKTSLHLGRLSQKCPYYYDTKKKFIQPPILKVNAFCSWQSKDHLRNVGINKFSTNYVDEFYSVNEEDSITYDARSRLEFDVIGRRHVRLLYEHKTDDIIMQLTSSNSLQNVFDILKKEWKNLQPYHLCQSILVLWDLQRSFSQFYLQNTEDNQLQFTPQVMLNKFTSKLLSSADFNDLLESIGTSSNLFNIDELSCVIFYLKNIGLDLNNNVMNSLVEKFHKRVLCGSEDISLSSIARYTSIFHTRDSLRFVNLAKYVIPTLLQALKACDSAENFKLITVCFYNVHTLISTPILELYKLKTTELINDSTLNVNSYKVIIKILNFLNLPHWSKFNSTIIGNLSKMIINSIKDMEASEIISLHKVFQSYLSPSGFIMCIRDRATQLLEQSKNDDQISVFLLTPDLLFCQIAAMPPIDRHKIEGISDQLMNNFFPLIHSPIYKILRYIKTSGSHVCDKFWHKTIDFIHNYDIDDYRLLKLSQKYMYFNSNTAGVYRCRNFEKEMMKKLIEVENSLSFVIPGKLARISAFFISYGLCKSHSPNFIYFDKIINKLEDVSCQLDILSCLILSKALMISDTIGNKQYSPPQFVQLKCRVDNILDKCVSRHIKSDTLSITDLNIICKTFLNRRTSYDTDIFHTILTKYSQVKENFSCRAIRDTAFNLMCCSIIVPPLIDEMIDYIAEQDDDLLGDTAQKVLQICYMSSYNPKNERFLEIASKVIERDKELVTGLSLLQACVALCFFDCLPESLVRYIFSIEFMEQLDEEISGCYSKMSYPSRIRKQLMNLNRHVCLELPEIDVPWFHEKYIQEQIALSSTKMDMFQKDVYDVLCKILGKREAIKTNHFSPYGYKTDFLIQTKNDTVIFPTSKTLKDASKNNIAILLLDARYYTKYHYSGSNDKNLMVKWIQNGPTKSKIRHLELMGYRVVEISKSLWNSMYMSEPQEKISFLYSQIWK